MQMAAFPYQYHHLPYAPDFPYLPSAFPFDQPPPPAQQEEAGDLLSDPSCLPCYYPTFDAIDDVFPEISTVNAGTSSISAITTAALTPESSSSDLESGGKIPCVDHKITSSSSSAQRSEAEPKTRCSPQKKRTDEQRCNSESAQSKDSEAGKSRKLRERSGAMKKAEEKKAAQVTPTGYIHVRARRGEATDSHSLAERVRREKIRDKMKMLQDLVPGCDKVIGKALLLEEIINYVQSLQNQVEFLSMKLASMDPMIYDLSLQLDDFMIQSEKLESVSPGLPNAQRTGHVQPTAMAGATKSYPLQDNTLALLLHEEGPGSFPQDNGSNFVMRVGDNGHSFLNHFEFNDMSFQ